MNDNDPWPVIGEAAASRLARILAHHASWTLAEVAAHHGMPFAGFLEIRATALLVAVARGSLALAAAQMESALVAARADGLIIGDERDPRFPPAMALGHWRNGAVSWAQPMLLWADASDRLWLVPRNAADIAAGTPAFRLAARYLRPGPMPWGAGESRIVGLGRAAALLRRGVA